MTGAQKEKRTHQQKIELQEQYHQITERNQRESPLLKLPGKIRSMIYEYVLGKNARTYKIVHYFSPDCPNRNDTRDFVNLMRISRQIFQETHLLPYKRYTFTFYNPCLMPEFIQTVPVRLREAIIAIQFFIDYRLFKAYPPYKDFLLESQNPQVKEELDFGVLPALKNMHICIEKCEDTVVGFEEIKEWWPEVGKATERLNGNVAFTLSSIMASFTTVHYESSLL